MTDRRTRNLITAACAIGVLLLFGALDDLVLGVTVAAVTAWVVQFGATASVVIRRTHSDEDSGGLDAPPLGLTRLGEPSSGE